MQNEKVNQNSQNAKLVNLYYFYTSLTLNQLYISLDYRFQVLFLRLKSLVQGPTTAVSQILISG